MPVWQQAFFRERPELSLGSLFRRAETRPPAAGNIRFSADRGENGHSDRFWALALALHAAGDAASGPCRMEGAGEDSTGSGL